MPDRTLPELDAELRRPGLPQTERLLVLSTATIGPPDWDRLRECVARGKATATPRSVFEETLLQATLFFGFPRIVTAFETLNRIWPSTPTPNRDFIPATEHAQAGRRLFEGVYGDNSDRVHGMLRSFHPEFHDFVIEAAYGRILSRPGLTPRLRELCALAALAVLEQIPQLVAHARGARRFGATDLEIREALRAAPLHHSIDDLMRQIDGLR